MALPAPRLDDRSFQDLVDDAKRFIQQRCPEWTDHNVSDPGVTLVETFAWMTDLLLYRLNRVPDRLYVKFLDLIGTTLFPPTAARVDVDFRLSAPQRSSVRIPLGTVVSTPRTVADAAVEFTTVDDLDIVSARPVFAGTAPLDGEIADVTEQLGMQVPVPIFSASPLVGDALLVGFDHALPNHRVQLNVDCERNAGEGIVPSRPPLRWEAFDGANFVACEEVRDGTGGFNWSGRIEIQLPPVHGEAEVLGRTVGLLRCRVVDVGDRGRYTQSPRVSTITGGVIGATTEAVNASFVTDEELGDSTGVAGQEYALAHAPVVPSNEPFVVVEHRPPLQEELPTDVVGAVGDAAAGNGSGSGTWEEITWEIRDNFADSGPDDRHVVLDPTSGVVRFGPMVRNPDGQVRQYGAIPRKGSKLKVPRYRVGGGAAGNVAAEVVSVLRTSIPFVSRVRNRRPARGGVDGESVEEVKHRGPIQLRTRNRAVTLEDFEELTKEAAPEIRRVRAITDSENDDPGGVRVLIVPPVATEGSRIDVNDLLRPPGDAIARIEAYLDRRRLVGTRVRVEPPTYVTVEVTASILVEEHADPQAVRLAALDALHAFYNPLTGGTDGTGWPFGRGVRTGEAYAVLQRVAGVDVVEEVTVRAGADQLEPAPVALWDQELVVSGEHRVEIAE